MDKTDRQGATVLSTHTPPLFDTACAQAADLLARGELVALPTETVYGLAANAFDAAAVARIYEVKGRPRHNPIIVHVASLDLARRCTTEWPPEAEALARKFWPGPLTLVLPRSSLIPDIVTAGGDTVGIRWPSHPIMQAVINRCGFPLAAPSANPANRVSPTTARHVEREIGGKIPLIVDGGQCQVGIESTVLDLSTRPPVILRPGMIDLKALQTVIPATCERTSHHHPQLKSPGLLPKHYAPRAKLILASWTTDAELQACIHALGYPAAKCHVIAFEHIPHLAEAGRIAVVPNDPKAYARALYAELHRCDESNAEAIIVERPPDAAAWQGIRDRLSRAAM